MVNLSIECVRWTYQKTDLFTHHHPSTIDCSVWRGLHRIERFGKEYLNMVLTRFTMTDAKYCTPAIEAFEMTAWLIMLSRPIKGPGPSVATSTRGLISVHSATLPLMLDRQGELPNHTIGHGNSTYQWRHVLLLKSMLTGHNQRTRPKRYRPPSVGC